MSGMCRPFPALFQMLDLSLTLLCSKVRKANPAMNRPPEPRPANTPNPRKRKRSEMSSDSGE